MKVCLPTKKGFAGSMGVIEVRLPPCQAVLRPRTLSSHFLATSRYFMYLGFMLYVYISQSVSRNLPDVFWFFTFYVYVRQSVGQVMLHVYIC